MSVEDLVNRLYDRVDAFFERDDVAAVMSEPALAEAAELEAMEDGESDAGPDPAVLAAVGWLFWSRYAASGHPAQTPELAAALDRFLPVRDHHPDALPELLRMALDLIDGSAGADLADAPQHLLFELGHCFDRRFQTTGERSDVDRAVAAMTHVVRGSRPAPPPLLLLVNYLIGRFTRAGGDPGDLDHAERVLDQASGVVPPGHPLRAQFWYSRVHLCALRFEAHADLATVDALVAAMSMSLSELGPSEPVRDQIAGLAGGMLAQLSQHIDNRDFERSVPLWRLGVAAVSPADPYHGFALFMLGSSIALRAGESTDPVDSSEAIDLLVRAVDTTDGPVRALSSTALGNAYLQRFERSGDPADAQATIAPFRAALLAVPADDERVPLCRTNLAVGLIAIYDTGTTAALDDAIDLLRTVTNADDLGVRARACSQLGNALRKRSVRDVAAADLDEAVHWHRAAVATEPEDGYGYPDAVNNLAVALGERYRRFGAMRDLDEAIELHRTAVAGDDTDRPRRLLLLANLAGAVIDRFERTSDADDAAEALRIARQATEVPLPPGMAVHQLAALSAMLFTAYEISGSVADLEEAVRLSRGGLDLFPDGDVRPQALLLPLGTALVTRYELTGAVADLDEAVALYRRAVTATRPGEVAPADLLSNLCNALEHQYHIIGDPALLDEAVRLGRAAAGSGAGVPARVSYLSNLGKAYGSRHQARGDAADLDAAIEAQRGALAAAGPRDRRRVRYLSNLGASLLTRSQAPARAADLDEAVPLLDECARATPPGDVRHAVHLLNLGLACHARYQRDHAAEDLDTGLRVLREAAGSTASPVHPRLIAALSWGNLAYEGDNAAAAADGYAEAVALLPILAWRGLGWADQERRLVDLVGTASDAAAAALTCGDPARAVELLERGRSVLWAQLLDLDTDLSALHRAHPELADRLMEARAGLDEASRSADDTVPLADRERRMALARQWEDTVAAVRRLDGYADFLRPAQLADLRTIAASGPVVLVNVSRLRCDAVVLTGDRLVVVPLQELTAAEVTRRADAFSTAVGRPASLAEAVIHATVVNETLAWLWRTVAAPVLDALGPVERLWWCPTGALARLPLHAAGVPGTEDSVLHRTVSSYTPTLRALTRARARSASNPDAPARMLVVAMPQTSGAADLNVQPEIDTLTGLLPGRCTVREGAGATTARVLADLSSHRLAHFACHGRSDPARPSRSALVLRDRDLTVADVSRLRLPSAELAYLSACSTATGGDLPDESLHLGSALHLSGYRHVVATLWTIDDAVAAEVARLVYREITVDGVVDLDRIPHAVRAATMRVRDDDNEYLPTVWASFVHIGP